MEQHHPTRLRGITTLIIFFMEIATTVGVSSRLPGWSMRKKSKQEQKKDKDEPVENPRTTTLGSGLLLLLWFWCEAMS
jgi:hypothetical protein